MYSYEIDAVKIEKQKAMLHYRRFRKITNAVKTVEVCLALMVLSWSISWSTAHLPETVKVTAAGLRGISGVIFSPHFVFIIGNIIIVILLAKSSHFSVTDAANDSNFDFTIGESEIELPSIDEKPLEKQSNDESEMKVNVVKEEREYRRTRSEVVEVEEKRELRRSKTEPRRKMRNSVEELTAAVAERRRWYGVEDLSSEEFRRKVEAFIEKQQRFLREESTAVVFA